MKLSDKQKVIALAGVFLLLIGAASALNYRKFSQRREMLQELDTLQSRVAKAQEKIEKIPGLLQERADLIESIDRYVEILPQEAHVQHDAFVEIIDGYRQDTEILIQKADYITPRGKRNEKKDSRAEESFLRHRYRFALLGTVPDFIEFVNKVENHTRFLKVDSFKIEPYAGEDGRRGGGRSKEDRELAAATNPVKQIEMTISTYTYKGAEESKES